MHAEAEHMTADLADELARNGRRKIVDPSSVPVRFHHLKAMAECGAHAYQSFQDERDETLSMRLGSGVHAMMFGKQVVVWDQPAANGKGGKAPRNGKVWDAFRSANPFATILSRKEHDKASRVVASLKSHPQAAELLFAPGVVHESTILWEQNGRARRSTPDARGLSHLVELKTTRCAEPNRFRREGVWRAYHAQVADQAAAIEASTGCRPYACYIVAVETTAPYVVEVFPLTQRALDHGARLCEQWLTRLLDCERSGRWPGYSESATEFDVFEAENVAEPVDEPDAAVFEDEEGGDA